jgi:hypothetical protein
MQFVERKDEINCTIGSLDAMDEGCTGWKTFWDDDTHGQRINSGL